MIQERKVLVFDVDGTLCHTKQDGQDYATVLPRHDVIATLRDYKARGFYIIVHSSRNMRTHQGNVGKINAETLPVLLEWLARHDVPYDEVHMGKPWQGQGGFYIDDKTIRPSEFLSKNYEEILQTLDQEKT